MNLPRLLRNRSLARTSDTTLDGVPASVTPDTLPPTSTASAHPLIGLAAGQIPVHLTPEHGHTLAVMPPGHGSTTLLRTIAAQLAATGTQVAILDTHFEHDWARHVPAITRFHDPDHIRVFLQNLAEELREAPDQLVTARRDRALLIETAGTTDLLAFQHGPGRPGSGIDALVPILRLGRPHGLQVVMTSYTVVQPLHASSRQLFTSRLVAHPSCETWQHLAAPGERRPPGRRHPGRLHLLGADAARTDLQVLNLTGQQALDLAAGLHSTRGPRPGGTA